MEETENLKKTLQQLISMRAEIRSESQPKLKWMIVAVMMSEELEKLGTPRFWWSLQRRLKYEIYIESIFGAYLGVTCTK